MRIVIPGEFTDLNTYVDKERCNRFLGSKIKKDETERVETEMLAQSLGFYGEKILEQQRSKLVFNWFVKNGRKDPDNICFAKKFILDGLVKSGVLWADNMKAIGKFEDEFFIDEENPRVEIEISQMC